MGRKCDACGVDAEDTRSGDLTDMDGFELCDDCAYCAEKLGVLETIESKRLNTNEMVKSVGHGNSLVLAFIGDVPVSLMGDIAKTFEKRYPGALCLDGGHPTSRKLGATFCIVPAEESKP